MNKHAPPEQLELAGSISREELLIQALPPHIDPESPAFKADMAKVEKIEKEETARAVLGTTSNYDDFDWTNAPSVVLQEQRATAVYHNEHGGIVIRQEKHWNEESDPHVVICQENFVTLSEALAKKAREG